MSERERRIGWLVGVAGMAATILVFTLSSRSRGDIRAFSGCLVCGEFGLSDALRNVLLFVPLGFALGRAYGGRLGLVLIPFALSLAVELTQTLLPGRYPGIGDIVTNTTGGALGLWLATPGSAPIRVASAILGGRAAAWVFAACAAVLVLPALLLVPVPSDAPYWTQHTPRLGNMGRYRGSVEEARLDGTVLEPDLQDSHEPIRGAILDGTPLALDITADRPRGRAAPIYSVYDDYERQIFMFGAEGRNLFHRYRSVAAVLRLEGPSARIHEGTDRLVQGESATIVVEELGRASCIRIDAERICPDSPNAAWLWSFVAWGDRSDPGLGRALALFELLGLGALMALASPRRAVSVGSVLALAGLYGGLSFAPFLARPDVLGPVALALGAAAGGMGRGWLPPSLRGSDASCASPSPSGRRAPR